jgi:cytidylate kinase
VTSNPADGLPGPAVRLITVSAAYGAGGSVVAPALAQRLGLPFLQRVTTTEGQVADVAPCHERLVAEEAKVTPVHRLLASFTHSMPVGPTQSPLSARHQDEDLRCSAEAGIHDLADGGGVILGRAAAVVLGKDRGYHVRLNGPPDRRIIQGATIEGISQEQASVHMQAADSTRTAYVRRLYRVDPADASLYHIVIDSTAIPLDTVIELILTAVRSHRSESSARTGSRALPLMFDPVG